ALLRQDVDERQWRSLGEQTAQKRKTDGARLMGHDQRRLRSRGEQVVEKRRQVLLGQTQQTVAVHVEEVVVRARRRVANVEPRASRDHDRSLGAFAVERASRGEKGG